MRKRRISGMCVSLVMGVSICMSSTTMAFAAEETKIAEETDASEEQDEEEIVDLTAFYTDGKYCYKGIPWLSSKEEAEEILGVSLEAMQGQSTKLGNLRSPVEFLGEPGLINLGFLEDGVTDISFIFGGEPDKYEGDLTELAEYVLEQFTEQYGENDEVIEKDGFKVYQWLEEKDQKVDTSLVLQCTYEGDRICNMVFGAMGTEATRQIMEKAEAVLEKEDSAEETME